MLNSALRALLRSPFNTSNDDEGERPSSPGADAGQPLFFRPNLPRTPSPPAPAQGGQVVYGQPPNWTPINGKGATPAQVRQALAANSLGVTGAGVKVGVISNNFNGNGYAAGNLGYGTLLPTQANVKVLSDFALQGTDDEGRAMMQVVHDVAPGAQLEFCTNSGTAADFQNNIAGSDTAMAHAILALAADGCKVICDDIVMQDSPMFQSGIVAEAIKTVEAQGVIYLSCAGNQNSSPTQGYSGSTVTDPAYQSTWTGTSVNLYTPTTGYLHYNNALSFNGSPFQALTLAPGAECHLELQWAQPWGNATTNLALAVSYADGSGGGILLQGLGGNYYFWTNANNPATPGESVNLKTSPLVDEFYAPSDTTTLINQSNANETVYISIINLGGPNPSLIKEIAYANGGVPGGVILAGANTGAVQGWHESPYQITVGAADAGNTPGLGSATPLSEYFSASGYNEQWFFDANGNALATPQNLFPVAITGVDDIDTSDVVNGHDYAGISDFFGTSCATPSVAGVAALMLQKNGALNTSDVRNLMEDSAIPMAIGEISGAGLVQANKAVTYAGGLIAVDNSHGQWLGTHLADIFVYATEALLAGRATYGFGGADTARIAANVTVKDADFVNLHNITTLQLTGGDTATVDAKATAAGLRSVISVNTGGHLNTVNASKFSVRLNAAQVSVVGGGDVITIIGAGNALSLYTTAGVADTVNSTQNAINLTNAQANIVGGGNIIAFVGATGNAVTLSATNGNWDGVSGPAGKVTLKSAQAAIAGGGFTITADAGSSMSLSQTGATADIVTVSGAQIILSAAQAKIAGGSNTVYANGGSTVTLTGTAGAWDAVYGANAKVTLTTAQATIIGSANTIVANAGSSMSLAQTAGQTDNVTATSAVVILTSAQAKITGGGNTVYANGASTLNFANTGAAFDVVYGSNQNISMNSALVAISGGGNTISVGAGSTASLYATAGVADTITAASANIYLSASQAKITGGGNAIYAGSGCAVTLLSTGGAWDTFNGTGDQVTLTNANASIVGGGNTISANTGSALSLYNTGANADAVTAAGDTVSLSNATASLTGNGDYIYFTGTNTLTVSGGSQNFFFGQTLGIDKLTGFAASDKIHLSAADWSNYAALTGSGDMKQSGGNVTISTDASNTITLVGVQLASLTQAQFAFA